MFEHPRDSATHRAPGSSLDLPCAGAPVLRALRVRQKDRHVRARESVSHQGIDGHFCRVRGRVKNGGVLLSVHCDTSDEKARAQATLSDDRTCVVVLLAFVGVLAIPFLENLRNLPVTYDPDALKLLSVDYVVADAVRKYGEYPLWNPYFGSRRDSGICPPS